MYSRCCLCNLFSHSWVWSGVSWLHVSLGGCGFYSQQITLMFASWKRIRGQRWPVWGAFLWPPDPPRICVRHFVAVFPEKWGTWTLGTKASKCFVCFELGQGSFPCSRTLGADTKKQAFWSHSMTCRKTCKHAKHMKLFSRLDLQCLQADLLLATPWFLGALSTGWCYAIFASPPRPL